MDFYNIDMKGRFLVEEDSSLTWVSVDDRRLVRDVLNGRLYIGTPTRFSEIIQDLDYSVLGGLPTEFKTGMDELYVSRETNQVTGDWDSYTDNGIYNGTDLVNSPIGSGWVYVFVMNHTLDPVNYTTQLAMDFLNDALYLRRNTAGVWTSWQEVIHDGNILSKITSIDGEGSGIDADLLDGQHGTYYGHVALDPTDQDPNLAVVPTIVTNHINSPDNTRLWHIHTTFYAAADINSSRSQIAVQYEFGTEAYVRSYANGLWQGWNRIDNGGISGASPTGMVSAFAMDTAPSGWLICDGTPKSRIVYSNLFNAIGTTFGVGDGSTTFDIPDLRGEFVRGYDFTGLVDTDRGGGVGAFGTNQDSENLSHLHTMLGQFNNNSQRRGSGGYTAEYVSQNQTRFTELEGGVESRPRNVSLLYCIKD